MISPKILRLDVCKSTDSVLAPKDQQKTYAWPYYWLEVNSLPICVHTPTIVHSDMQWQYGMIILQ